MENNKTEEQTNNLNENKTPKIMKYLASSALLSWILALSIFSISISSHARTKQ